MDFSLGIMRSLVVLMNMKLLLGVVVAVFVAGAGVLVGSESIRFDDVLGTLSGL